MYFVLLQALSRVLSFISLSLYFSHSLSLSYFSASHDYLILHELYMLNLDENISQCIILEKKDMRLYKDYIRSFERMNNSENFWH